MLKPEYLDGLPNALVELYAQAETDILADMARRISTYDYWIPAAEHQRKMLREMGVTQEYIIDRLTQLTGKSNTELTRLFQGAGLKAIDADTAIYEAHGLKPLGLGTSKELQKVLQAGLTKTANTFKNLTRTTAHTATRQFENALDRAYMQIITGGMDYNTAIRSSVKELSRQGVTAVRYPSGHCDTLEVAVRRATLTGINQTALQMQDALAVEMDCDLVETTAHAGARPDHATWQGGVYSRSGRSKKYRDLKSATGYGSGSGLGGWNCRHSFFPYFEGDVRAYTQRQLKKLDEQTITYNGRKMNEYEATQAQREIERNIRRWKRENAAMKAAGQPTTESAAKLHSWEKIQADFLKQTGLKPQNAREQI